MGGALLAARDNLQAELADSEQSVTWGEGLRVHSQLPVMLAYIGKNERCTYHNDAFRRALSLSAEQIDGRVLRALLGQTPYAAVSERIGEALAGRVVHYREQPAIDTAAETYVHLVPHFDVRGGVDGFYALVVDEAHCYRARPAPSKAAVPASSPQLEPADLSEGLHSLYDERGDDTAQRRAAAAHLRTAIRAGEFRLYNQSIRQLSTGDEPFRGIFVRQAEEEEIRLPPGMFLALTEEFGLQGELDRWIISTVLQHSRSACSVYCINLSRDSIGDPYFPRFVSEELARAGVAPQALCFEIQEADVIALRSDSEELVRRLRDTGVRVMLAGFGRNRAYLELLKGMRVDFLKIDGSIILNVARSEAALSRVRAIVRVARALGINTVADLVESDDIARKLRELEVDYAQGVAVSPSTPLTQ